MPLSKGTKLNLAEEDYLHDSLRLSQRAHLTPKAKYVINPIPQG